MGGGGISSSRLKQLLIESDSNTVQDGKYTITYSADSRHNHGYPVEIYYEAYNAVGKLYNNIKNEACCWISSWTYNKNSHWWMVDLGRTVNNVCKFSFNVTDALTKVASVKWYSVYYAENTNYTKEGAGFGSRWYNIDYTPEEPKETFSNVGITTWKPVIVNFDPPINVRCLRLEVHGERSQIVSVGNCLLYAQDDSIQDVSNKQFFLKESDNNIYDNILSEKISTLDNWKRLNKQEKLNLLGTSCKPGVLDCNKKLKSFGSFKILSSEDL